MAEMTDSELDDYPQSIVAIETGPFRAIMPTNMAEAYKLAKAIWLGGFYPDSYLVKGGPPKVEKILSAVLTGMEIGMPPMRSVQQIAIINGQPCIWGDAVPGLCYASGHLESIQEGWTGSLENMDLTCTFKIRRKGYGNEFVASYGIEDAVIADLWGNTKKQPWVKHGKRMLKIRARSYCCKDAFPDIFAGVFIREEIEDTLDLQASSDGVYRDAKAEPPPPPPQQEPEPTDQTLPFIDWDGKEIPCNGQIDWTGAFMEYISKYEKDEEKLAAIWETNSPYLSQCPEARANMVRDAFNATPVYPKIEGMRRESPKTQPITRPEAESIGQGVDEAYVRREDASQDDEIDSLFDGMDELLAEDVSDEEPDGREVETF